MRDRASERCTASIVSVEDSAEYWNSIARRRREGKRALAKASSKTRERTQEESSSRAPLRRRASRSPSPQRSSDGEVVLSANERLCAMTMIVMIAQVFRGAMTTRDVAHGVIAMWSAALASRAAFGNQWVDSNTPPLDRVALLVIKLLFTIIRWAVMTCVSAPRGTILTLWRRARHRAVDEGWDDDAAAFVATKDLGDDVRECVTNKDYETFAKAVANDEGEWDVIASGKVGACTYRMLRGVSTEDKANIKLGIAKFRTEVLMAGISAEVLFDAQTDLLGREKWDSTTLHPTQLAREAKSSAEAYGARDVVYWRLQYPRLMAPRDYVVVRRQWRDSKNNTLTCICRDALHAKSAVEAKKALQDGMGCKAVDVKTMYSAIMVGPSPEVKGSQYVSIYYEDPGVPPRLTHVAAAKGLDKYMATFEREIQRRSKSGARDLSDVPPPPSVDGQESITQVSFTTGRVSSAQQDKDETDVEESTKDRATATAATAPHFAPTNASREYRFRGHGGLGKRQRIRRRIRLLIRVMQDLVDPKAAKKEAKFADEDDEGQDPVAAPPVRGRTRRWLKRAAFGALVWVSRRVPAD